MATDFASIDVVAGDDILASEYNTLRDDTVRRAGDYETATGSSNAFAVTIDSSISSYTEGLVVRFKANHTITGSATLNVNGIGAQTLKKNVSQDMESGDIITDQIVTVIYDGTNFQVKAVKKQVHFEDPGLTDDGAVTTGDTTKTVTVTTGFLTNSFEAIVQLGIVNGDIWTSSSNSNGIQQGIYIKGEIGGNVVWRLVEDDFTASPPDGQDALNPMGDERLSTNPTDGSGTAAAVGAGSITAPTGSATFVLTSVTATSTTLVFTFTFTHNSDDSGLRYGVRYLDAVGA